jgi:hypothetical protein
MTEMESVIATQQSINFLLKKQTACIIFIK